MPRVKSTEQVETLERQRKTLLAKLKEAKATARAAEREKRLEKAKIAGLAVLEELEQNPSGPVARDLLALLDIRLTRRSEREAFGLPVRSDAAKAGAESPGPVGKVEASAAGEPNGAGSDVVLQAIERALIEGGEGE